MRIALSAKRLSVYIRVQKGISYTMNSLYEHVVSILDFFLPLFLKLL